MASVQKILDATTAEIAKMGCTVEYFPTVLARSRLCKSVDMQCFSSHFVRIAKTLRFPNDGFGPMGAEVTDEAVIFLAKANKAAKSNDLAEAQHLFGEGVSMLLAAVRIYIPMAQELQNNPPAVVEWALATRARNRFSQDPPPYQA